MHEITGKFLDGHKLISDSQYGFRPNNSTSMALINLVEEITKARDHKQFAVGVFIDLKKAFDTTDYNLLINKLERLVILDWVKTYLRDRI